MEDYQKDFVDFATDSRMLFFKQDLFLKDGRPTPYFFNSGNANLKASYTVKLAEAYAAMIHQSIDQEGLEVTTLFGPAYKGIPLVTSTAMALFQNHGIDLGYVFDRKEEKDHGEGGAFVGEFPENALVYMIDDVITSGETKYESVRKIKSFGRDDIRIVRLGIAFDREQVGAVYDESKSKDLPNRERVILGKRGENVIENFVKKTGISVDSIIGARGAMDSLYRSQHPLEIDGEMRLMDSATYDNFKGYMGEYGTK